MKERLERLRLARPVEGWFAGHPVEVMEIGTVSARVAPRAPLPEGTTGTLRFVWNGAAHEVEADIASGGPLTLLQFTSASPSLADAVEAATRELAAAQLANVLGAREANVFDGDLTLTAASEGARRATAYLTLVLTPSGWKRRPSLLPDQPQEGFTVSAAESEEQIAMLCETYANGDDATRELTRMLASMSISATTSE